MLVLSSFYASASIDTIAVYSNAMHKDVKVVVILPEHVKKDVHFPTVYLLHGYAGNYSNWVTKVPEMQQLSDDNKEIIVCPDAAFSSWYFDSPIDSSFRYETFTAIELPQYIDAHYNTIANRKARAIAGLSMGGHGAMFLALRHTDIFGACGSMSGALMVQMITNSFDVPKRLGDTILNKKYYEDWSVYNLIEHYDRKDSLAIIMDCGADDFIYLMSKNVHEKMLRLKIPHDYIERPGRHEWPYWRNSVQYQLLFFKNYFKKNGIEVK